MNSLEHGSEATNVTMHKATRGRQAYIHTCIHTYIHTCIHTYIHTCILIYIGETHDEESHTKGREGRKITFRRRNGRIEQDVAFAG